MKKILYTLFLLTLLMGCKDEHTKKYSYSDLKSAVDEQDAQKICLILDSIETLPVEQLNEITYKSLSKYKNYEIPKMFYEYGLDINEVFSFESALNSENRLDTVKWLINNKFDPNKKMTYDISQDTELTVKEAAWEYAHRIRLSYYDENGVLDEEKMKADPTWLSFQSVIDYLDN
ncbi:hypothetical protein [Treponema sp.]|uniref:hypothetical protein n=1 Tax=Treponema sp. TaxID=166 RepID=UPI00388FF3B4